MRAKIVHASKQELVHLEQEIAILEQYRDNTAVVQSHFDTKAENIVLEAQLAEAQQQSVFFADIKTRLDERLRAENERLAEEKRQKSEALLRGLLEELKKPKVQDSIMKKCIVDLGKVKASNTLSL